jgi:hypothetical protein
VRPSCGCYLATESSLALAHVFDYYTESASALANILGVSLGTQCMERYWLVLKESLEPFSKANQKPEWTYSQPSD